MPNVSEAIDSLKASLRRKTVDSHVRDASDHLASCLVLLNSSSPSVQMIQKLSTVLRQQFLPLYNACLQPALQLSCAILSAVLTKLCDAHNVEGENLRAAWDTTAKVVLCGTLDFLDQADCDFESDVAVWQVLCRLVCEFFFHDSGQGQSAYSIQLRLSAYNTLTETAARQVTVRNALRNKAVLGGERLGAALSRTRDYLVLEALLMLFGRLLPPIRNISQGKSQRAKFVKEVFGSPKLFKCSAELLDIMQRTSETHWDDISAQVIDVLARSDVTYPQPFSIDEINVCGRVFPQPLATDRLIMDRQTFLANIIIENDDPCDSLQIPYSHIRTITLDSSDENAPKGKVLVTVYLTSPPLVADIQMESPGESPHAKFFLEKDAVSRFMEALRRRGVGRLSFLNPQARSTQRKRKNISIGSGFKFINNSSPTPPTASFEGKVQHVNQVYKTGFEDPTMSEIAVVSRVDDAISSSICDSKPAFKEESDITLVPGIFEATVAEDPPTIHTAGISPHDTSKSVRDFTFSLPENPTTFDDRDELSEISEFGPEDGTVNIHAATSSNQRTDQKVDCTQMNGSSDGPPHTKAKKSSVSNFGDCAGGVARGPSETEKPLSSYSPIPSSSSSTKINVSPVHFSNVDTLVPVRSEVVRGLPFAAEDLVCTGNPKRIVDRRDAEFRVGNPAAVEIPQAGDQIERHTGHVTASSGGQMLPRTKSTENTSVPPKIAGSRRKRETFKSPSRIAIEVDDEPTPRKKCRDGGHGIAEHKMQSDQTSPHVVSVLGMKRSKKSTEDPSCDSDPTIIDVSESLELMPSYRGTRRSSRIKKKQRAETGGTRVNNTYGKSRKGKRADDTGVKTRGAPSNPSSQPASIVSSSSKNDSHVSVVGAGSAEIITTYLCTPDILKGDSILSCQPGLPPAEKSEENPDLAQQPASSAIQLVQDRFFIKSEETIDDGCITSDSRTMNNEVNQLRGVINRSTSSKDNEGSVEQPPLNLRSTPQEKTIVIDLTMASTPIHEKNGLQKTLIEPVRSEANNQATFTALANKSDSTAIEAAFVSSPRRHGRRSVAFASPIEYMLDNRVESNIHASSSKSVVPSGNERPIRLPHIGIPQSHRSPSPSESNTLSPLMIPTEFVSERRGQLDRITTPHILQLEANVNGLVHQIANGDEIQDIVEVLNEIQAVIIKGISDRFRNARKDVQRGREELIRQVLDELREMAIENAKYFNELLHLEEDYHESGKAITHSWEGLIDSNDGIAVQVRKVLKEHDRNTSTRSFPRSFPVLKPAFLGRRTNA